MPGHSYNTVVTQVMLGNNAFHSFANPTGTDAGGKFITIQGEYGLLKMYENGEYTYQYNTGKKDGDLTDDFKYTIRDEDGDTSTTTLIITVGVNHVPVVSAVGGIIDEAVLLVPGTDTVTNTITINSTDGVSSIKLTTDGLPTLSADGKPVVYTVTPDGKTLTGTAGGEEILKVELGTPVTQPDGSVKVPYTFTLEHPLDNPGDGKNVTNIPVNVVVTDPNGDAGNTTIPLQVIDDVPHAVDDSKALGTASVATGNIITNDSFGADGAPLNGQKVVSITYGSETKNFTGPDSVVTFTTPKGTLEVHADGSYTFTRNPTLGELNETFTYTIKDADGDASTAKLTLTGNDHPVVITTPDPQDPSAGGNGAPLHESDLLIPGTDSVTKNISFTAPDGVASIKLNTDGLPALSSNGQPVTYTVSQDGKTLTGVAGGKPVFTVEITTPAQQADGSYKAPYVFTLLQPLTNPGTGENVTNIPVKFVVTDTDGDNAAGTLPLQVIDDVPHAVSDAVAMGTNAVANGNVLLNGDTFGADGVATGAPALNSVTYGAETKTFTGPDSVLSFTTPSGTLSIHADGSYTFTRVATLGNLNEVFNYSIKDADGDISSTTLTITGNDNPVTIITPNPQDPSAGGNGAIIPEHQLTVPGTDSVSKDITFTAPDGVASIKLSTDGLPALNALGQPVAYTLSADGKTITGTANGQTIFTVVLGNAVEQADHSFKASYVFTLIKPLDNPGTGENVTNIPVKFVATDTDGDAATGTLPLQVVDDVPHAVDDAKAMGATSVATGNIITNDTFGADGALPNGPKVTSITYGSETKTFAGPDSVVSFTTPKGILEIHADGSYTFTRSATLGDLNETFNYSIKDADGDISTAKLTLTGNDNPVTIITPNPQDPSAGGNGAIIQEHQLLVPGTDSVTKDITFTAPDGVASIKLSTDGMPALTALGQPVSYSLSADGKTVTGTANGQTIFTVVLGNPVEQADHSYKASYVFTLVQPLDNPGAGENVTNIPVKFIAVDTDGDSATGTLPLQVVDDVPVANDDVNVVANGGEVYGNVINGDGQGNAPNHGVDVLSADGPNKITSISFGGTTKSFANAGDVQQDGNGKFITINGDHGTLKIYDNGTYAYVHNASSAANSDQFKYVLTDHDGDSDPATLTITSANSVPTIPALQGDKFSDETTDINVAITGNVQYTNASSIALGAANGSAQFNASGSMLGGSLHSNGQDVHVALIDGKYVGYTGSDANASGAKVFELTMNGSQYSFKQFSNLDHANGSDPNDVISLKFAVTAKDADGDTATGELKIDVRDDAPVAHPDTNQAVSTTREFNVIGGAPDFPTLQEQKNLPKDRPDLYAQGVAKASNVNIDLPTTVTIERLKSSTEVSIVQSPLFAFTQDANGNITNIQLIFGVGSANPGDNGPTNADYQMTSGGKLGFFIAGGGTNALTMIGAIDANGNVQPGFSYTLKANDHGTYDIQYTHNGQTNTLNFNGEANTPLEARFGGEFLGQDVQGVAGRQDGDANNVLRYGFEDLSKNISDEDYNDVQIKVTINPIIVEVTDPIHGNVLPNDVVGQDDIHGLQYGTQLTQVAIGQNAFTTFANATGVENGMKFISLQGEYGLLKMFQDGHYTYVYNTDKKDGDMTDDFKYTITDNDGDTSTTTLTIGINLENHTTTASLLSAEEPAASARTLAVAETGIVAGDGIENNGVPEHKQTHDNEPLASNSHDVDGQLSNDAVSYTLGHQGSDAALVNSLTSNGEAVHTIVVGDVVHGFTGADYDSRTADVFTLTLGQDGHYNFDLQGKIDQASTGTVLSFDYTAKETDGSAVEGHIAIGVEGTKVADSTHSDALHLNDVLGSQPTGGDHSADSMNHVASIDIINDILSDDDPHNGYAG